MGKRAHIVSRMVGGGTFDESLGLDGAKLGEVDDLRGINSAHCDTRIARSDIDTYVLARREGGREGKEGRKEGREGGRRRRWQRRRISNQRSSRPQRRRVVLKRQ